MTRYALAERLALADLMAEVGPDAPTLCGDWTVRDLLAHLLLRERRPDAAGGILIKRLAGRTARVQQRIAGRDFAELLRELRDPPWWSPVSNPLVDEAANLTEMFIHLEDVRRAAPGWLPRGLSAGLTEALWRAVGRQAKLTLRRYPVQVRVTAPGHGTIIVGRPGTHPLSLTGTPGELLMFLSGRQAHARASVDGTPEQAARLRTARLGV
ncbi:TIGR03085 family metal-binding protein [Catellatospora tritici]|uniref:TIGR03085 family metal-binding protein n=1 Tax=Catellatospora tritici TaxID=2851566 RepID=UPI001C2D376F|nr:TIGR03085 family metal-binding protein [Catellatospora tritici]MBV1852414.1 TIGR03085 family protein [Catellatospora tritici]